MGSWARSRKPAITLSNSVPDGNLIAVGTSDAFKTAIAPCTMEWPVEAPVQYCSPSWSKVMPWASQCRHMAKRLAGGYRSSESCCGEFKVPFRELTQELERPVVHTVCSQIPRVHLVVRIAWYRKRSCDSMPLLYLYFPETLLTSCSVDRPPASVSSDGRSCFFRSEQ